MLFVTYWELNENMSIEQRQEVAEKLTTSGLFPPQNVKIIRWDATPDGWGVLITEAQDSAALAAALNMWRAAGAGFFNLTKTAPATPVQEAISNTGELLKAVSSK